MRLRIGQVGTEEGLIRGQLSFNQPTTILGQCERYSRQALAMPVFERKTLCCLNFNFVCAYVSEEVGHG